MAKPKQTKTVEIRVTCAEVNALYRRQMFFKSKYNSLYEAVGCGLIDAGKRAEILRTPGIETVLFKKISKSGLVKSEVSVDVVDEARVFGIQNSPENLTAQKEADIKKKVVKELIYPDIKRIAEIRDEISRIEKKISGVLKENNLSYLSFEKLGYDVSFKGQVLKN